MVNKPVIALLLGLLLAILGPVTDANALQTLEGPYRAIVEKVVDGDTLAVRVTVWLNQELHVLVRVRGIDAPERRGKCDAEKAMAKRASAHLHLMTSGGPVVLTGIARGKYWGRVLADITTAQGNDVATAMLRSGLARPYQGARRGDWCSTETAAGPIN